jgi:ribosomal protein L23
LQSKKYEYEVAEESTLQEIKKKIEDGFKINPSSIKLIHSGQVLKDDNQKLKEIIVKPKDFLVLIIIKV